MRPNELRMGNLVSTHMGIGTIQQLRENYARVCVQGNNQVSQILDYDRLEGIPLTEEWLERLGFEPRVENDGTLPCFKKTGKYTISKWIKGKWQMWIGTVDVSNSPQYVHQLQNIYHALTGDELEVRS